MQKNSGTENLQIQYGSAEVPAKDADLPGQENRQRHRLHLQDLRFHMEKAEKSGEAECQKDVRYLS